MRIAATSSAGLGVLEQEAARPGPQRRERVLVQVERGQHEHAHLRVLGGEPLGRLDAVHPGHPHVHQHHVGVQRAHLGQRRGAVARLADHLQVVLGVQDHREAHPQQRLVVDEQHPDRARRSSVIGPPPGSGMRHVHPPPVLPRSGLDGAAQDGSALAHPDQPLTGAARVVHRYCGALVDHLDLPAVGAAHARRRPAGCRARAAARWSGTPGPRGTPRAAGRCPPGSSRSQALGAHRQARGPEPLDEARSAPALPAAARAGARRPGARRARGACRPSAARPVEDSSVRARRVRSGDAVHRRRSAVRQGDHHREAVRDDVVHLARDPDCARPPWRARPSGPGRWPGRWPAR